MLVRRTKEAKKRLRLWGVGHGVRDLLSREISDLEMTGVVSLVLNVK